VKPDIDLCPPKEELVIGLASQYKKPAIPMDIKPNSVRDHHLEKT
jgi:hypothetical protein